MMLACELCKCKTPPLICRLERAAQQQHRNAARHDRAPVPPSPGSPAAPVLRRACERETRAFSPPLALLHARPAPLETHRGPRAAHATSLRSGHSPSAPKTPAVHNLRCTHISLELIVNLAFLPSWWQTSVRPQSLSRYPIVSSTGLLSLLRLSSTACNAARTYFHLM